MDYIHRCKILTPMYLNGSEGKNPEMRSPSLKASLRFWFRAIHPNLSVEELRKKESIIFGGSYKENNKEVSNKSSFILIATDIDMNKSRKPMFPTKPPKDGRDQTSPADSFVNGEFEVIIRTQEAFLNQRNISVDYANNIFKISSLLGSLGKRSRRGFGAYHINGESDPNIESIYSLINSINPDIYIQTNETIEIKPNIVKNTNYPYLKEVEIGKRVEVADKLTEIIYKATHNNNKDTLGYANQSGRFASPIYVSAIKSNDRVKAIISTLNTYDNNKNPVNSRFSNKEIEADQNKFKGEIL